MSPRNFAKQQISPYFLTDPHFNCDCGKHNKTTSRNPLRRFINFLRSPAKVSNKTEWLPYQGRPDLSE